MVQPSLSSYYSANHSVPLVSRDPSQQPIHTPSVTTEMEQQWREAEEVFFKAIKLYIDNNFDQAEVEFKRALQICPEYDNAKKYLNLMPTVRQLRVFTHSVSP